MPEPTGGELRQKLEEALKRIATLEGETGSLRSENVLLKTGYGHLSERQQRAIVRELEADKLEATAENFKKVAEELGYKAPEGNGNPPGDQNGQQQAGQPNPPAPPNPNDPQPYQHTNQQWFDPNLQGGMGDSPVAPAQMQGAVGPWSPEQMRLAAMQGQFVTQQAMNGGQTDGAMTPEEFNRRMNGITSQEEGMALIRQHGHVVGMMDASQLD